MGERKGEERWASQRVLFSLFKSAPFHIRRQWGCRCLMSACTQKPLDPWPEYELEMCMKAKAKTERQFLFRFSQGAFRYANSCEPQKRCKHHSVCPSMWELTGGRCDLQWDGPRAPWAWGNTIKAANRHSRNPSRTISVTQCDTAEARGTRLAN